MLSRPTSQVFDKKTINNSLDESIIEENYLGRGLTRVVSQDSGLKRQFTKKELSDGIRSLKK